MSQVGFFLNRQQILVGFAVCNPSRTQLGYNLNQYKYMSKRKSQYLRYLESGHWKTLRKMAFERDGHKCTSCGGDYGLQGHHRRYRRDFRFCTVDDIQTLCYYCHRILHKKRRIERRRNRKPRSARNLVRLIMDFSSTDPPH